MPEEADRRVPVRFPYESGQRRKVEVLHPDEVVGLQLLEDGRCEDLVHALVALPLLEAELAATSLPFPVRVFSNKENLGLSRSLNRALANVETDYVLTSHLDCRFASDHYVARVVDLLDRHPDVGVVSGQPIADVATGGTHLQDVSIAIVGLGCTPSKSFFDSIAIGDIAVG